MSDKIELHPVQAYQAPNRVPKVVTLAAYEVYSVVFAPQKALITDGCRGGFGVGELIAFLYARSFPKEEWRIRFYEAINGQERNSVK